MATRDEVIQAIRNADKAGDSAAVRRLGEYLGTLREDGTPKSAPESAAQHVGNLAAGAIRGAGSIGATILWPVDKVMDMVDGGGQPSLSDVISGTKPLTRNEQRRKDMTDALESMGAHPDSLMFGGGKLAAEVAGTMGAGGATANALSKIPQVAQMAPGVINAVRTSGFGSGMSIGTRTAGGAISGAAGAGMVDPSDALMGAAVGGALPGTAKVVGTLGQMLGGGVRGAIEPFTQGGRQAIAGRTMQRFGITPQDVTGLSGAPSETGAQRTLAELIQRPEGAAGAARLQDAVRSLDPEIAARMEAREVANNAARVASLEDLAGAGGGRDFAAANRAGTAGPMYQDAFTAVAGTLDAAQKRALLQLKRSPAIQMAQSAARANASNAGQNVGASNATGSVEGLHQMKLALDDMITKARNKTTGAAANEAAGLEAAQKRLVSFIESISPEYANARGVYAQMSKPVNQMDIAAEVLKRGAAPTADLAGNPRLMAGKMAQTMSDEGALIKNATGRDLGGSLATVLEPKQLKTIQAVADEVDRVAAVARAGNGPGSATAQRLSSSNLLQQMGLPENMVDNSFVQTLMRPIQFGAKVVEPRVQQAILEIIQDPSLAEAAMRRASPPQRAALQRLIESARLAAPAVPVLATSQ